MLSSVVNEYYLYTLSPLLHRCIKDAQADVTIRGSVVSDTGYHVTLPRRLSVAFLASSVFFIFISSLHIDDISSFANVFNRSQ